MMWFNLFQSTYQWIFMRTWPDCWKVNKSIGLKLEKRKLKQQQCKGEVLPHSSVCCTERKNKKKGGDGILKLIMNETEYAALKQTCMYI